jgi:tRNA-dihydrouridine synthase B
VFLGKTRLPSNVILAPMAGITDQPFRRLVREFGDFLMFSEMVASNAVIRNVKRTYKMIEGAEDKYTSVQIVGADPKIMAEAAEVSFDLGARFIDINMGCPVKKIVKSEAGAALMKDEKLAAKIMESVVNAVKIPVSLKIRLGWDQEHKNAKEIAKIAENSGIQMITVHGRTRSQLYSGKADWKAIGEIKDVIKTIPVIANGDIVDINSAKKSLQESGADGIMIGRGALGSPWVLKEIQDGVILNIKANNTAKRHISHILDFYENSRAITQCKKVLIHYCKGMPNASSFRNKATKIISVSDVFSVLNEMSCEK